MTDFRLRDATPADADQLTALHLLARSAAMPWLVSPYDRATTRRWMEHVVLTGQRVRTAHRAERLVGFAALHEAWLEQLYVHPDEQDRGVGRALVHDAKRISPAGLSLRVFTRNTRARRFYEAAGFTLSEQTDGSDNEEREPDCTYVWSPSTAPAGWRPGSGGAKTT